mmetsp:Transcript_9832/g.29176  ORF Transcript_9832/g.29176 Transcript_9832/m.29176 type:complete len:205 (-) Transcript_9832:289-903(-)
MKKPSVVQMVWTSSRPGNMAGWMSTCTKLWPSHCFAGAPPSAASYRTWNVFWRSASSPPRSNAKLLVLFSVSTSTMNMLGHAPVGPQGGCTGHCSWGCSGNGLKPHSKCTLTVPPSSFLTKKRGKMLSTLDSRSGASACRTQTPKLRRSYTNTPSLSGAVRSNLGIGASLCTRFSSDMRSSSCPARASGREGLDLGLEELGASW